MANEVTEQIVRESPDIEAYKLGLLQSAKQLANAPPNLPAYQVAGLQPDQLDALAAGRQGIGAYAPYIQAGTGALNTAGQTMGEAANILRGADTRGQFSAAQQAMGMAGQPISNLSQYAQAAGQGIGQLGAGSRDIDWAQRMAQMGTQGYNPYSYQAYMNPYTQAVIDQSLQEINRQGAMAQQNLQAQAVRSGAFGGSREGIQRAELERNLAQTRNQAIVNALSQGYSGAQQQAQQAFEQQQGRQLGAANTIGQLGVQQAGLGSQYANIAGQQANISAQQAQLQQALGQGIGSLAAQQYGIGQNMAQGLGSLGAQLGSIGMQQAALGQAAQGLGQNDVNFQYNLGAIQQKQQQAELDALRASQMQQATQPYQNLAFLSDIYKGAPSTQMAITQQAQAAPSPFQQIAGLATGVLATGAALGGGGGSSGSNTGKVSLF